MSLIARVCAALASLPLLTACGASPGPIRAIDAPPPAACLEPGPRPALPAAAIDALVAAYIVDAEAALDDRDAALDCLKSWARRPLGASAGAR